MLYTLYQTKHESRFLFFTALTVALGAAVLILGGWNRANAEIDWLSIPLEVTASTTVAESRLKPEQQTVKAIYLTAYSANNPKKIDAIIKLLDATELNAVVIDIKDYTGYVLYDSQVPLVKKLRTQKILLTDIPALIKKLHSHHIYVIARQTVFQDPALAERKPEWAVTSADGPARNAEHSSARPHDSRQSVSGVAGGGLWRDFKGLAWVDATRPAVWNYNIAIAKEAIVLGFDEINFDYVRFPSDGNIKTMRFFALTNSKHDTMAKFYAALGAALADEPAWLSLDLFGLTMEVKGGNDMNIGQRIVDAVDNVDYIAPMMYPSHYPPGHLGLSNPADHPAAVLAHGMQLGAPLFEGKRAQVRPWLQAFNMGAIYDGAKIRAQIDEVEKYSSAGWMLWNASNRYSEAGLKSAE